jgi:putative acetyltransferase
MTLRITLDDLSGQQIQALLREHLACMAEHSPPESVHALDLSALRQPDISFWTAWENQTLMGCGALKVLSPQHGEVKSMRTVTSQLRKGAGKAMLEHIIATAQTRGLKKLSLETGSMQAFAPARAMYERSGFVYCGPFGDYIEDPYSVFMTRELKS